jgi:hypothetical protein
MGCIQPSRDSVGAYTTGNDTGSANAYAVTLSPAPAALTPGMMIFIDNLSVTNNGASTLNVNGMGKLPITGPAGAGLEGGEMAAGYGALLRVNHAGTAFTLLATTGGALPVKAATASNQAVNLGQLFFGSRKAIFTSSGTYTVPAGITQIWVSGAGGGGGGGGGNQFSNGAQGAGGGGGYAGSSTLKTPVSVTPGQSLTITIGAGGAAGAGTSSLANAGNGSAGGATTIVSGSSTLINLPGGVGGSGANVYNTNYVYGGYGYSFGLCLSAVDSSYAFSGLLAVGGNGQFSPFSTSGGGGGNNNNSGNTGTFGGGGGGGGSTANGGAGGNGYLIIEW